jgi:hypothetical protein
LQNDLDESLLRYNTQRPHQGLNMNGRTPYQVFVEGLLEEKEEASADPIEGA